MSSMSNIFEKEIYGVDVSDFKVMKLTKSLFPMDVVHEYSSNNRLHFLVHAKQFGIKPPTQKGMKRTEKRNAEEKAKIEALAKAPGKNAQCPKLSMKSPQEIVLKCARKACIEKIEKQLQKNQEKKAKLQAKWHPKRIMKTITSVGRRGRTRTVRKIVAVPSINPEKSIYFQKKKANQIRRRAQKTQLIKDHKEELKAIYGDVIFTRGWRISRQEIKKALGLPEDAVYEYENVGEDLFQEIPKNNIPQPVNGPTSWVVSSLDEVIPPKKYSLPNTIQGIEDEFPSILSPLPTAVTVSAFARKK